MRRQTKIIRYCSIIIVMINFNQMITIANHVRTWVTAHPTHAAFMSQGLVNASALARYIKPELERQTGEYVSVDAITLALNRLSGTMQKQHSQQNFTQYIGEISVQPGLSIITIPQVGLNPAAFSKAIAQLHKNHEYTLYSRGVWHTALIGKSDVVHNLASRFTNTIILDNLAAVTLKLKPGHLPTPGVCAFILQQIAFAGVSLQEVTSSHDEMTVIVTKNDLKRTLSCFI